MQKRISLLAALLTTVAFGPGCTDKAPATAEAPPKASPKETGKELSPAVASAQAPAKGLPDGPELLAKAVEAAGGHAKLSDIKTLYKEGKVILTGQNIGGSVKAWWSAGDFYTETIITGVGPADGGKQGDVVWTREPIYGLRKIDGVEVEQALWNSTLLLAADWPKFFKTVKTVGERSKDGKKLYDLELTSEAGTKLTLSVDAASGLQVGQAFSQASPMGDMPVKVEFQDFREVKGVMFPFREVMDASLATVVQEFTTIEVNVEVDTSKFAMPTGGAEIVPVPMKAPGNPSPPAVPATL